MMLDGWSSTTDYLKAAIAEGEGNFMRAYAFLQYLERDHKRGKRVHPRATNARKVLLDRVRGYAFASLGGLRVTMSATGLVDVVGTASGTS